LPDRQHDQDQVGVAVVQRVRAAGDTGGTALVAPGRERPRLERRLAGDAHAGSRPLSRHSTNELLMNGITGSPCWFTPVLRLRPLEESSSRGAHRPAGGEKFPRRRQRGGQSGGVAAHAVNPTLTRIGDLD
jgi:hypothetical protein